MHTADGVCSFSKDIVKCIHTDYFAYESFEMEQTVATDNNLVCANDYCVPLIDTFMVMGFLIGSFVFGRRHILLITLVCMIGGNLLCVAFGNKWGYGFPRMFEVEGNKESLLFPSQCRWSIVECANIYLVFRW